MVIDLPPTRRSATLSLQALISGRVEDSLTHTAPLSAFTLHLIDRDRNELYPLLQRLFPDGTFAFYGDPQKAFPAFATKLYHLRLEASAVNYQSDTEDFDIGATPGQPASVSFSIPTSSVSPIQSYSFTGGGLPRENILLSLSPLPVKIAGRVVISDKPTVGIAGATVQLNPTAGPSTTTNADGFCEFAAPLGGVRTVAVRATALHFQAKDTAYDIDFLSPINHLLIPIVPAP